MIGLVASLLLATAYQPSPLVRQKFQAAPVCSLAAVDSGFYTPRAATGLKFGSTVIQNSSTAPTSGQCIKYDGTNIAGGSCGTAVTFSTTTRIPYMNAGGTDFIYSSSLTFDGTSFATNISKATRFQCTGGDPCYIYSNNASNIAEVQNNYFRQSSRWALAFNGTGITPAATITLNGANVNHIAAGATAIDCITDSAGTAVWPAGSVVILVFDGAATVNDNSACGGAGTSLPIDIEGGAFTSTARDTLTIVKDTTAVAWLEVDRSVN